MVTRGRFLTSLVVLATLLSAPGIASAATVGIHSDEVGPNTPTGTATRAAVTALQNDWRAEVVAAGGIVEDPVRFLAADYTLGQSVSGIVHTAADGTTLAIHRTRYTTDAAPAFAGNSTSLGTLQCTGGSSEGGQLMQGDAPRPDVLTDGIGCTGTGGFYYNVISGTGEGTTRDAIEFTFGRPVLGFGSWFGDLESRVAGGGVAALMRLYDESGTLLSETTITPTATTCSNATTGCGNDTTRWLGFVADPTEPVSRMVVIVGDEDVTGTATAEGLSIIGPTLAMFPEIGLAKRITGVTDNLDGTQTVDYEFLVESTGDVALSNVDLVDDLTATFGTGLTSVGPVSVDPASGLMANPAFDGVADTTLATGALAIGASAVVSVSATVLPASAGPFINSATVTATAPRGDIVSDTSQEGTDADADGDGDPGNDSGATPVTFALTGSITVTTSVTNGPSGGITGDHAIEVSCVPPSGPTIVRSATLTLTAATSGSSTLTGIPVGSECTVEQVLQPAPPVGYAWTTTTGSGTAVTLSASGENAAVAITNDLRLLQGDLALSLSVTGAPAGGLTDSATYSIDCGPAFTATRTITLTGATSGSVTLVGIPDGASCTIVETDAPDAPSFFEWDGAAISPSSVTIVDGGTAVVTATRTLRALTGEVEVTYDVTGAPAGGLTGDAVIALDCGAAGTFDATIPLAAATTGTATVTGIPAPSSCVVTSPSRPAAPTFTAWAGTTITASPVAVTDGGTSSVTVTDALRATEGSAELAAAISGGPASGLTGDLTVRLDCGPAGSVLATLSFAGTTSATATLTGISAPADCTVSPLARPDAPDGYVWVGDITGPPGTVTITDGGATDIPITGTLQRILSTLAVTIDVVDAPAGGVSGSFGFTVDCGAEGSFTVVVPFTGQSSATGSVVGIPAPATCTVTETARPLAPTGYRWTTASLAPFTASVTSAPSAASTAATLAEQLPTLPLPSTPSNPTTPASTPAGSGLAETGAAIAPALGTALGLLLLGGVLLLLRRRPQRG
jgi:hypothetical protein